MADFVNVWAPYRTAFDSTCYYTSHLACVHNHTQVFTAFPPGSSFLREEEDFHQNVRGNPRVGSCLSFMNWFEKSYRVLTAGRSDLVGKMILRQLQMALVGRQGLLGKIEWRDKLIPAECLWCWVVRLETWKGTGFCTWTWARRN